MGCLPRSLRVAQVILDTNAPGSPLRRGQQEPAVAAAQIVYEVTGACLQGVKSLRDGAVRRRVEGRQLDRLRHPRARVLVAPLGLGLLGPPPAGAAPQGRLDR